MVPTPYSKIIAVSIFDGGFAGYHGADPLSGELFFPVVGIQTVLLLLLSGEETLQ